MQEMTAKEIIRTAKMKLTIKTPAIARVVYSLVEVETKDLPMPTMGVDANYRLLYDPDFVIEQGVEKVAGVLYHECGHLLRHHHLRALNLPQNQQKQMAWNIAGDLEINDDIISEGVFTMPDDICLPSKAPFNYPDNLTLEEYLKLMEEDGTADKLDPDKTQVGSGNCGGCSTGEGDAAADAQGIRGLSAKQQEMLETQVAEDVQKNMGSSPEWMREFSKEVLNKGKLNWKQILRAAVRQAKRMKSGATDYSYRRPSRRSGDVIMPSLVDYAPKTTVLLDTSGSMFWGNDMNLALAEIDLIIKEERLPTDIICVDAAVKNVQKVKTAMSIKPMGGGGTDLRVGLPEVLKTNPDICVIVTDGMTPWPEAQPPNVKLIACIVGSYTQGIPDWMPWVKVEGE